MSIPEFALSHNIDEKLLRAILSVESKGPGIDPITGMVTIRFELHIFTGYLTAQEQEKCARHFSFGRDKYLNHYLTTPSGEKLNVHSDQKNEYDAFFTARLINNMAALESTSYGAAQVMGFNYFLIGYKAVYAMYLDAWKLDNQEKMFFDYLINRPGMLKALQDKNLEKMAELYNGSGNIDYYVTKLKQYYS